MLTESAQNMSPLKLCHNNAFSEVSFSDNPDNGGRTTTCGVWRHHWIRIMYAKVLSVAVKASVSQVLWSQNLIGNIYLFISRYIYNKPGSLI